MKNKENLLGKKTNQGQATRYVLYVRQDSVRQGDERTSIENRREALRRYAADAGITVASEFQDFGSANRPHVRQGFAAMLSRLERGDADGILCVRISQLARNHVDLAHILWLRKRGKIQSVRTLDGEYISEDDFMMIVADAIPRSLAAWKRRTYQRDRQSPGK
jgi:DNA invertase Pin-like site-specific DNA recombinase